MPFFLRRKNLRIVNVFLLIALLFTGTAAAQGMTGPGDKDPARLVGLLGSRDGRVKSQAMYALVGLGKDSVPALLAALDKRENLKEVIFVLNSIKDERAAGPLARLLDVKDPETLGKIKSALFSMGPVSMPYLFDAMKDADRRKAASETLVSMKYPKYYDRLRNLLEDKDPSVRRYAALAEKGWLDRGARAEMAALLKDGDAETRRDSSAYFLGISPDFDTPGLTDLLKDPDAEVRITAIKITIKDRYPDAFGEVAGILAADPDAGARKLAAEALFRCYRDKAAGPLTAALKDRDESVAAAAAGWLGVMKAKEAVPDIVALLKRVQKPSDEVVESVARSLGEIGGGYDANVLLPYVNWENLYVVRSVLNAWEAAARPEDSGIKKALANYLAMQVDVRYKDRAKMLLQRLSQAK